MPRQARIKSATGIYHIMIRGINKEKIFMSSIHKNKILEIVKKINVKYAMYYNKVEKRYGHVFQDRFKSEAVEDDNYLIGVLRCIHNNPVKAGIVKNIEEYK
ncbi:hypothetical protein JYG23_13370 [Sedimentibacter sp. zth1]|uniref:hypothetical protein n=1 Tax=Sedimentibacter sp. zth1 TaxID=2816908 RepID=UPI001A92AFB0|nr:hypothetical protein [Sedimentibacter sp. zth1]QSX05640.1 hypothetical protein JYG23_13370 [Sedimentibacter sp. zth1]